MEKLNKLSSELKAKLSSEDFLAKVDRLEERYGIKAVMILLDLLLGELDYSDLAGFLAEEYGFNQFLAGQIKSEFAALIELLGAAAAKEGEDLAQAALAKKLQAERAEIPVSSMQAGSAEAASMSSQPKKVDDHMIQPAPSQPQAVQPADAGLIFSAADEEEINKFGAANSPKTVPNYTLDANKIIGGFSSAPRDPDLARRLSAAVISRLRDLRDDLELKELLTKDISLGGLGLTADKAAELVRLIKNPSSGSIKAPSKPAGEQRDIAAAEKIVPKDTQDQKPPVDLDFGEPEEAEEEISEEPASGNTHGFGIEMEDGLPVLRTPQGASGLSEAENNVKIQPENARALPAASPAPFIAKKTIPLSVLNAKTAGRPNLDDVKLHRKLSGPIDQLAEMTLIEFRRLGNTPSAATEKVRNMIELLGQESFDKRHQGIAAWQESEVCSFYRLLGQAAMNEGATIEEAIKDRLVSGKPTLTLDEFNAVMELNRHLRY